MKPPSHRCPIAALKSVPVIKMVGVPWSSYMQMAFGMTLNLLNLCPKGGDELALHSSFLWEQGKNPFIYHCERNKLFSHDDLPKALETIKTEKNGVVLKYSEEPKKSCVIHCHELEKRE